MSSATAFRNNLPTEGTTTLRTWGLVSDRDQVCALAAWPDAATRRLVEREAARRHRVVALRVDATPLDFAQEIWVEIEVVRRRCVARNVAPRVTLARHLAAGRVSRTNRLAGQTARALRLPERCFGSAASHVDIPVSLDTTAGPDNQSLAERLAARDDPERTAVARIAASENAKLLAALLGGEVARKVLDALAAGGVMPAREAAQLRARLTPSQSNALRAMLRSWAA